MNYQNHDEKENASDFIEKFSGGRVVTFISQREKTRLRSFSSLEYYGTNKSFKATEVSVYEILACYG